RSARPGAPRPHPGSAVAVSAGVVVGAVPVLLVLHRAGRAQLLPSPAHRAQGAREQVLELAELGVDVQVAFPAHPVRFRAGLVDQACGLGVCGLDDLGLGDQAGLLGVPVGHGAFVGGVAGLDQTVGLGAAALGGRLVFAAPLLDGAVGLCLGVADQLVSVRLGVGDHPVGLILGLGDDAVGLLPGRGQGRLGVAVGPLDRVLGAGPGLPDHRVPAVEHVLG